jgi:hypothetical protein
MNAAPSCARWPTPASLQSRKRRSPQTRKIIELEAKVVMTGMALDEAKSMLADIIMNLDVLRPKIEASDIAKMLESRNRTNLYYTHRDYSPPPSG